MKPKFVVGGLVILLALGYMIWAGVTQSAVYFVTPSELQAAPVAGKAYRLGGLVAPGSHQVEMVVGDVMNLAGRGDQLAHDLLTNLVIDVYKDEVPRNGPGRPRHEPTLSHL